MFRIGTNLHTDYSTDFFKWVPERNIKRISLISTENDIVDAVRKNARLPETKKFNQLSRNKKFHCFLAYDDTHEYTNRSLKT